MQKFRNQMSIVVLLVASCSKMVSVQNIEYPKHLLLGDWGSMGQMDEMEKNTPAQAVPSYHQYPINVIMPVIPPRQKLDYIPAPDPPPHFIQPIRLDIRVLPSPVYRVDLPLRPFQPLPPEIPAPYPYLLPVATANATKSTAIQKIYKLVPINETETSGTTPTNTISETTPRSQEVFSFPESKSPQVNEHFSAFNAPLRDTETNVIDTWKHPSAFSFAPPAWFPNLNNMKQYLDHPVQQANPQISDSDTELENSSLQNMKRQEGMTRWIALKKGKTEKKIGTLMHVKRQGTFDSISHTFPESYDGNATFHRVNDFFLESY